MEIASTIEESVQARAGVVWVTGYSAAGKTTVGRKLERKLRESGLSTVFLDGDDLRSIFANRWGYDRQDRVELAKVYFRLCSHLASQGVTVVIAAVAMYDEVRDWLHTNIPNAIETYLDVPEHERRARDENTKGVYAKNQNLAELYDEPKNPDLVIQNFDAISADVAAETILEFYFAEGLGRESDRGKSEHWDRYYKSKAAPSHASPFAVNTRSKLRDGERLLEVGCGNGRDAVYFATSGVDITAIDLCPAAIDYCKSMHPDLSARFACGRADDFASKWTREFASIYSRFCIHAMTRQEESAFLQAASTLLRPNGRIFIECRSINDPLAREGEVTSPTERIFGHYRRFIVLDELTKSLEHQGFEVVDAVESCGFAVFGDEDPVCIRVTARLSKQT
jgi:adenylylsulfate kinase-like enzyme/2-polyprenyl-3-methyl-5-hydroxy-6-metoxy-1,4-benzoquinol methylase